MGVVLSWWVASLFLVVLSVLVCFVHLGCPSRLVRGPRPRCVFVLPQARDLFSSLGRRFLLFVFFRFVFFFVFVLFFLVFRFVSFKYLSCWRAYVAPVVSSTMKWHCIVYSLYCITM